MRHFTRVIPYVLLALSGACLMSCDDDFPFGIFSSRCETSSKPIYSGAWRLEGQAERTNCNDETRNGSIRIRFREAWNVTEAPFESSEDNSLFGPPESTLEMETGSTATVVSTARTNGLCVEWTTQETYQLDDGTEVIATLEWTGTRTSNTSPIDGEFDGRSSDGCEYDGTFWVEID